MKTLTIGSLMTVALLSAALALTFVRSSPANSPGNAIVVSDLQGRNATMKETVIADYSLVFPQDPLAERK